MLVREGLVLIKAGKTYSLCQMNKAWDQEMEKKGSFVCHFFYFPVANMNKLIS